MQDTTTPSLVLVFAEGSLDEGNNDAIRASSLDELVALWDARKAELAAELELDEDEAADVPWVFSLLAWNVDEAFWQDERARAFA